MIIIIIIIITHYYYYYYYYYYVLLILLLLIIIRLDRHLGYGLWRAKPRLRSTPPFAPRRGLLLYFIVDSII